MALQIQIGTSKANANIAQLEASVARLEAKMRGFNSGGLKTALAGIGSAKPIPASVPASFDKTSAAANKTAASVKRSQGAFSSLRGSLGGVRSGLGLIASALATVGITQFVSEAWKMNNAMDSAKAVFTSLTGSAQGAGERLAFVKQVAKETATPIGAAIKGYQTLSQTAVKLGVSQKDVDKTFRDTAVAFRAVGASAEQSKRGLVAVTQVFSKGKAGAEELRQQMGEIVPIIPAIAQALQKTPAEIEKAMSMGTLSVEDFRMGISKMAADSEGILAQMMENVGAKATNMSSALSLAAAAFGAAAFPALIPIFEQLTQVFNGISGEMGPVATTANRVGQALGVLGSVVMSLMPVILTLGAAFLAIKLGGMVAGIAAWTKGIVEAGIGAVQTASQFMTASTATTAYQTRLAALGVQSTRFASATAVIRGAMLGLVTSMVPVVAVIGSVIAAYGLYMVMTGQTETLTKQLGTVMNMLTGSLQSSGAAATKTTKSNKTLYKSVLDTKKGADYAKNSISGMGGTVRQAGNDLQTTAGKVSSASSAFGSWSSSASSAASGVEAAAARIIAAAERAIAAIQRMNAAKNGGGGGGGGIEGPSMRMGGVVGRGNHSMARITPQMMRGAPHFANGGVTGATGTAGIPAVLHPNEAVIPLKGGAVPVRFNAPPGGSTTNQQRAAQAGDSGGGNVVALLREGNLAFGRVQERLETYIQNSNDSWKKNNDYLFSIKEKMFVMAAGMNVLAAVDWNALTAPAPSGGGYGGGGFGGGFGGGNGQFTEEELRLIEMNRPGGGGSIGKGITWKVKINLPIGAAGGGAGAVGTTINMNYDKEVAELEARRKYIRDLLIRAGYLPAGARSGGGSGSYFASGTPNTSKEGLKRGPGGGMPVTVHPDEAIIPLPDGRSVPVIINGGSKTNRLEQWHGPPTGNGQAPVSIQVDMKVDAKDAASFERTKQQMMQDLTLEIRRAMRSVGEPDSSDLSRPTQRVVR